MSIQLFAFWMLRKNELRETGKSVNPCRKVVKPGRLALAIALGSAFGAAAFAQPLVAGQAIQAQLLPQLSSCESEVKTPKEGEKEGSAVKDGINGEALPEELRQMRQLIERLEARVNQLEADKSDAWLISIQTRPN